MPKSFKAFVFGGELAIYNFVSNITAIATKRNLLLIWTQALSLWLLDHIEKSNVKIICQSSLAHVGIIESMIQTIGYCRLLYWTNEPESKLCPPTFVVRMLYHQALHSQTWIFRPRMKHVTDLTSSIWNLEIQALLNGRPMYMYWFALGVGRR